MVLKPGPLHDAIESVRAEKSRVILLSPQGRRFDAASARWLAELTVTAVNGVDRVDESRGPLFQPSGFVIVDLTGRWRINDRLWINAGIFNLGDRSYHEWADVRGRVPNDPLLELYQQPGRNASVTLTAIF